MDINLTSTATNVHIGSAGEITCRTWGDVANAETGLVLIHGLGGHSGWFEALASRLKPNNIFCLAPDLSGFGIRKENNNLSIQLWLKEIEMAFDYLVSLMPDKPVFLLGNSMGGLLALTACQHMNPAGLALLSPAFAGNNKYFPLSYQLKEAIKALLNPKAEVRLPYGTDAITANEICAKWIDADNNRRYTIPGQVLLELVALAIKTRLDKIYLNCPLFIASAQLDEIVDNKIIELVYKQIHSDNKVAFAIEKSHHDLTLDLAVEEVSSRLTKWISSIAANQGLDKVNYKLRSR